MSRLATECMTTGPRTWNDLPDDVTSAESLSTFRQRLKTHLLPNFFWLFPGCRRAFPVAGPTVWNSLQPDELRDPACDVHSFKQFFKTILFSSY